MTDFVLSSTPISIQTIYRKLDILSLNEFRGLNSQTFVSIIREAVSIIDNNKDLISNMIDIIFNIIKTISKINESNYTTNIRTLNLDELILCVQEKYNASTSSKNTKLEGIIWIKTLPIIILTIVKTNLFFRIGSGRGNEYRRSIGLCNFNAGHGYGR